MLKSAHHQPAKRHDTANALNQNVVLTKMLY